MLTAAQKAWTTFSVLVGFMTLDIFVAYPLWLSAVVVTACSTNAYPIADLAKLEVMRVGICSNVAR